MGKKVLVVGDVIIDKYTHGRKLGVSAETPTIVAEWEKKEMFVGGAGLVVRNLLRLGCDVTLLTVTAESLTDLLIESSDPPTPEEMNRFHHSPFVMLGWKLTRKHRYFVDDYKLLQYDVLNKGQWDQESRRQFFKKYCDLVDRCDAVVFCDNRHGIFDQELAGAMTISSGERQSFVDCQVSQSAGRHEWFYSAKYMLLNERELNSYFPYSGLGITNKIEELEDRWYTKILVKRGALGAQSAQEYYPGEPVTAVDTCGAGDAFLAALVSSNDIHFANKWAAASCTYKGTVVPQLFSAMEKTE